MYLMIRLCIFDMDGLLVDSERYMWNISLDKAIREQGFVLSDEIHRKFMGTNDKDVCKILQNIYGDGFDAEKMLRRCKELNLEITKNGIPLMKGARELLDFLHVNGIKTCIGTTTNKVGAHALLKADHLENDFDAIVCGDEIENGKPAPDIYLKCLSKFNFDKSEAIILEDGNAGAHAAISSGMRLVLVPDLAILDEEEKQKAFRIVDNLGDVIDIIREENEGTISF